MSAPPTGGSIHSSAAPTRLAARGPTSLRVGLLAPPWVPIPPPRYGGTESMIDRLARGLQRAGHEVRLWTTGDAICPVPRGATFDVACRDMMGSSAFELRHTLEGYEWLADQRCDIVHDHTLVGPFLAPATLPVITTNHGPFDSPELAAVYRHTPPTIPIIAISRNQASAAPRLGINISHVIHHGIDVDEIPEGDGRGDDRGSYLLFLGRMSPTKGVLQAIEVARTSGSRLLIAAKMTEPQEIEFFEREVAPRCADGIEYVGEVGAIEKYRLLGAAAALLSPIQWPEPFGLVMIEALATGTPVVSTPRGAAPEIITDGVTGFLRSDRAALVDAVRTIDRIDRRTCRDDVARRFSTEHMVARHVAAYRQLLASHSSPPIRSASPRNDLSAR
jgi:glycosyltransferase involved in cell wall biosynthesis